MSGKLNTLYSKVVFDQNFILIFHLEGGKWETIVQYNLDRNFLIKIENTKKIVNRYFCEDNFFLSFKLRTFVNCKRMEI